MALERDEGPLRIGARFLEKYQLLRVLGRGGHGYVYEAMNVFMGRKCALKILTRRGSLSDEMRHRGQTEAALLGKLAHPNIVQVYDAGVAESGDLYIVMELLEGKTLAERLKTEGPLDVVETLELLEQLCSALEAAHAENAIHRDLKPSNIFLTDAGPAKVLDFGVAKIVGASGWQTAANMVVGTCLYMSPEQIQGQMATPRSDLYSLGLVAYEALLGEHPLLHGDPVNPKDRAEISLLQVRKIPKRLDEVLPSFPEYVGRLVHTALVKRPGQRFESAKQMAELTRACRERFLREPRSLAPREAPRAAPLVRRDPTPTPAIGPRIVGLREARDDSGPSRTDPTAPATAKMFAEPGAEARRLPLGATRDFLPPSARSVASIEEPGARRPSPEGKEPATPSPASYTLDLPLLVRVRPYLPIAFGAAFGIVVGFWIVFVRGPRGASPPEAATAASLPAPRAAAEPNVEGRAETAASSRPEPPPTLEPSAASNVSASNDPAPLRAPASAVLPTKTTAPSDARTPRTAASTRAPIVASGLDDPPAASKPRTNGGKSESAKAPSPSEVWLP